MAGRKSTKRASQSKRVAQLFYIFVGFLLILIGKADIMAVRAQHRMMSQSYCLHRYLMLCLHLCGRSKQCLKGCAQLLLCGKRQSG